MSFKQWPTKKQRKDKQEVEYSIDQEQKEKAKEKEKEKEAGEDLKEQTQPLLPLKKCTINDEESPEESDGMSDFIIVAPSDFDKNIIRRLIRWYVYDPTLFKLPYRLINFKLFATPNPNTRWPWLKAKLAQWSQYLLQTGSLPTSSNWRYGTALSLTKFIVGAQFFTDWIWAPTLAGLEFHDWGVYEHQSLDRYGTTLGKIWSGIATNEYSIASLFGTDVVSDGFPYWGGGLVFLPTLLVAFGLTHLMLGAWGERVTASDMIRFLEEELTHSKPRPLIAIARFVQHWLWDFMPISRVNRYLSRANFQLLWALNLSEQTKKHLVGNLFIPLRGRAKKHAVDNNQHNENEQFALESNGIFSQFALKGEGFAQYYSLRTLAYIAYSFSDENLSLNGLQGNQKDLYQWLGRQALKTLQEARKRGGYLSRSYNRYLLWTLGEEPEEKWFQAIAGATFLILPGLLSVWTLYAKARFVQIIALKAQGVYDYYEAMEDCDSLHKVYNYVPALVKDDCTYCANLPEVNIANINNPQACLDDYFKFTHSSQAIIKVLKQFKHYPHWSTINLSQQALRSWSDEEFADVLSTLASSLRGKPLQLFNLSSPIQDNIWPSSAKINLIANFLEETPTFQLDFARQGLGPTHTKKIILSLQNSTEYLDFSDNQLTDEIAPTLFQRLPSNLKTLILRTNQLGDLSMQLLKQALVQKAPLTNIDLGYNVFGQNGLDALGQGLARSHVLSIKLNGNDLSGLQVSAFLQGVMQAPTQYLNLAFTNFADEQLFNCIPTINNSSLTYINVANNAITDASIVPFIIGLNHNRTRELLVLAGNQLTNQGLMDILPGLIANPIKGLDIDNCPFDETGFISFVHAFGNTSLVEISVARNALGDSAVANLAQVLQQPNVTLQTIDISDNQLTDDGASVLIKAAVSSPTVNNLYLRGNALGPKSAKYLASGGGNLQTMDLDHCGLNDEFMQMLAAGLPHSQFRKLRISNNPNIGSQGMQAFITQLIIPNPPHVCDDGRKSISRDERRFIANNLKSNTRLQEIDISKIGLKDDDARLICRLLPKSGITFNKAVLLPNPSTQINLATCRVDSAASGTESFLLKTYRSVRQYAFSEDTYLEDNDISFTPLDDFMEDEEMFDLLRRITKKSSTSTSPTVINFQIGELNNLIHGNAHSHQQINRQKMLYLHSSSHQPAKFNPAISFAIAGSLLPFVFYVLAIIALLLVAALLLSLSKQYFFNQELKSQNHKADAGAKATTGLLAAGLFKQPTPATSRAVLTNPRPIDPTALSAVGLQQP